MVFSPSLLLINLKEFVVVVVVGVLTGLHKGIQKFPWAVPSSHHRGGSEQCWSVRSEGDESITPGQLHSVLQEPLELENWVGLKVPLNPDYAGILGLQKCNMILNVYKSMNLVLRGKYIIF